MDEEPKKDSGLNESYIRPDWCFRDMTVYASCIAWGIYRNCYPDCEYDRRNENNVARRFVCDCERHQE